MAGRYSRRVTGGRGYRLAERLWALARDLPARQAPVASIAEFDQDCWCGGAHPPTGNAVAEHARLIYDAELT